MPMETSPESPAPVRTVSRMLADWINRLGAVWIDGQVAEYRPRPGARFHYFVLRDTDVDMSLSVKADASVIGRLDPPLAEGQRIISIAFREPPQSMFPPGSSATLLRTRRRIRTRRSCRCT